MPHPVSVDDPLMLCKHPIILGLLAVGGLLVGCGTADDPSTTAGVIDERAGTWRGAGLEQTNLEIRERLGPPIKVLKDPFKGGGHEDGKPAGLRSPRKGPGDPTFPWGYLPYEQAGFSFATHIGSKVYTVKITEAGARTLAGARIGQPLDEAAARYPHTRCVDVAEGHNNEAYRYCYTRLSRHRWLALGQDPVRSIWLSSLPIS